MSETTPTYTVKNHNLEQAVAIFAAFTCLDMFEDFFRAALNMQNRSVELDRTAKQHMYIIDEEWKRLKKYIRKSNMMTQETFGDTAEVFKELMLQVIDAGDEKPEVAKMVLNFANQFAKQMNLNIIIIGERQSMKNRNVEILLTNYQKAPTLF